MKNITTPSVPPFVFILQRRRSTLVSALLDKIGSWAETTILGNSVENVATDAKCPYMTSSIASTRYRATERIISLLHIPERPILFQTRVIFGGIFFILWSPRLFPPHPEPIVAQPDISFQRHIEEEISDIPLIYSASDTR